MGWEEGNKHILEHHAGIYDYCVKCGSIVGKSGLARQSPFAVKSLPQHKQLEVKNETV